jgi:hypothetical protein
MSELIQVKKQLNEGISPACREDECREANSTALKAARVALAQGIDTEAMLQRVTEVIAEKCTTGKVDAPADARTSGCHVPDKVCGHPNKEELLTIDWANPSLDF